jgi:integrase
MDAVARIPERTLDKAGSREAKKYRSASKSAATKRAIAKGWRQFTEWCKAYDLTEFPCDPETAEAYLVSLAESGKRPATIDQAKYAIDARHKAAGIPAPGDSYLVKTSLAGIRRTVGTRQRRTAALTLDHVRSIQFKNDIKGLRDRALLMVAVCGGLRRSELSSLLVEDIEHTPHGMTLYLERSKSDQEGSGVYVDIVRSALAPKLCPVEAVREWIAAVGLRSGPLFPSMKRWNKVTSRSIPPEAIAHIVKWAAEQCGLDPRDFSGHSPRAGCATFLLDRGVALNVVANHLRHKSMNTTRRYDRNSTARALSGVY